MSKNWSIYRFDKISPGVSQFLNFTDLLGRHRDACFLKLALLLMIILARFYRWCQLGQQGIESEHRYWMLYATDI
jgi:hypothetical protein